MFFVLIFGTKKQYLIEKYICIFFIKTHFFQSSGRLSCYKNVLKKIDLYVNIV